MYKRIALVSALSFSLFCYANTPQTTDWMPENSFTQGVEGPAVDKNGNLYAVNYSKEGTIGVITAKNTAEIFLTLKKGSIANGIRFDQHDNMYMADYVNHNVLKYSPSSSTVSIFAHNKEMSQPNDLAIMDNGILFASDPNWKESKGRLWRINKDGTSTLLEDNMGTTNGIEVSPDNKTLYVNESVQRTVWRYQLDKAGNISNKALFHQFENHGLDGMRTDKQGNLYIARYGAGKVAVLNPTGQLIKTIDLKGKHPTNVAFGGKSGQQVFVTMQKRGTIETFSNDIAGRLFR